jgi:Rad3-related DNA helicase
LEGAEYKAQVIAKLPAHPWLDQYVVKRNEYDTSKYGSNVWYDRESANKLMQSYGRICRTPMDEGITYVLDKAIYGFWRRYQNKYFYKWFNEAITVM